MFSYDAKSGCINLPGQFHDTISTCMRCILCMTHGTALLCGQSGTYRRLPLLGC